jgi:hypothetical protein
VLEQPRALACVVARRSMFGGSPRRIVLATPDARRVAPLAITPSDRTSKREVEPARKRERVAASLREDPLSHALVEWPFVPILPRSCCWAERRPRARASWVIANRCRRVARRRSS